MPITTVDLCLNLNVPSNGHRWPSVPSGSLRSSFVVVRRDTASPLNSGETSPHIRDTNHLFLELPLLKDRLEKHTNKMSVVGSWSQNAVQTTNSWLKEGLKPRCITRDLKWGVPAPHEKYSDKVNYSIGLSQCYLFFSHQSYELYC